MRFASYVLVTGAIVVIALIAWQIAEVFMLVFGGIVLATAIRSVAVPLSRATHLHERVSVAVVVVLAALAVAVAMWLFGKELSAQLAELSRRVPLALEQLMTWLEKFTLGRSVVDATQELVDGDAPAPLAGVLKFASTTLGLLGSTILILFLGIYFALEPRLYVRGALRLVPPRRRTRVLRALHAAGAALRRWLVGQIAAMVIVGLLTGIGLWMLDVPLAFGLGVVAGIAEFVPVIGPIIAAVPGILVAFPVSPLLAGYAALLYVVIQQLEGNLITPLAQRWAVALPPAVTLISVVACGLLFGIFGVIFATPVAVVAVALVKKLYVENVLEETTVVRERQTA